MESFEDFRSLVENNLRADSHSLNQSMFVDQGQEELVNLWMQELRGIEKRLRHYTGLECVGPVDAQMVGLEFLDKALHFEEQRQPQLEKLAVKLINEELKISADIIKEARLSVPVKFPDDPDLDEFMDLSGDLEIPEGLAAEVKKRKFLNALVQGASRRGQYLFHMADRELKAEDPDICRVYGAIMACNEYSYWLFTGLSKEQLLSQEFDLEKLQATMELIQNSGLLQQALSLDVDGDLGLIAKAVPYGYERLHCDPVDEQLRIEAQGLIFPVLIHELYKGALERVVFQGLPEKGHSEILTLADRPGDELKDLCEGPILWNKVMSYLQPEDVPHRLRLLQYIALVPAKPFLRLIADIKKGTPALFGIKTSIPIAQQWIETVMERIHEKNSE